MAGKNQKIFIGDTDTPSKGLFFHCHVTFWGCNLVYDVYWVHAYHINFQNCSPYLIRFHVISCIHLLHFQFVTDFCNHQTICKGNSKKKMDTLWHEIMKKAMWKVRDETHWTCSRGIHKLARKPTRKGDQFFVAWTTLKINVVGMNPITFINPEDPGCSLFTLCFLEVCERFFF